MSEPKHRPKGQNIQAKVTLETLMNIPDAVMAKRMGVKS